MTFINKIKNKITYTGEDVEEAMDESYESFTESEEKEFLFGKTDEEMLRDSNERLREKVSELEVELAQLKQKYEGFNPFTIDKTELEHGKIIQVGDPLGKTYHLKVVEVIGEEE